MSIIHSLEVMSTDFIARHVWKFVRPLFQKHLSPRCARCIVSSRSTTLNQDGLCPECAAGPTVKTGSAPLHHPAPDAQKNLDELIAQHAGKTPGPYDAIVLMSGGKDSAYLLHRLVKEYPALRILSMMVNNGFMSPHAIKNLHNVLQHFDVPHITVHPKPSFVHKVFRYTLTHLSQWNGYTTVDLMDGFITFDHARNFAAREGIPLVICGMSKVQAETLYQISPLSVEAPRAAETAPLRDHVGLPLRDIFSADEMAYWFDGSKFPPERVPRFVLPFTVWPVSEEEILAEVHRLGLISKNKSRPLVTNNALIPVIGMAEVARFGYCSWEIEFARMIREGKSERDYWLALFEMLEYSTKSGKFINNTVTATLKRLGLTKKDLGIEP